MESFGGEIEACRILENFRNSNCGEKEINWRLTVGLIGSIGGPGSRQMILNFLKKSCVFIDDNNSNNNDNDSKYKNLFEPGIVLCSLHV